jgi:uncharacterized protein YceK
MRVAVLVLVVVAGLSGCAAKVLSASPRSVVVKAHVQDYAGAQKLADGECSKHQRHARLMERPGPTTAEFVFDCVN